MIELNKEYKSESGGTITLYGSCGPNRAYPYAGVLTDNKGYTYAGYWNARGEVQGPDYYGHNILLPRTATVTIPVPDDCTHTALVDDGRRVWIKQLGDEKPRPVSNYWAAAYCWFAYKEMDDCPHWESTLMPIGEWLESLE